MGKSTIIIWVYNGHDFLACLVISWLGYLLILIALPVFFLLYAADLSLFDCTIVELIGLELVINVGRLVLMSDYNVACRIANGLLELILKILLLI